MNQAKLNTLWIVCCVAVASIHALTLARSPHHYQDEAQILDQSRTVLDPESSWGINWIVDEDQPRLTPAWLGTVLQDFGFRATRPSTLGSRLIAMIAAVVGASCLLGWLVARGIAQSTAFLVSLALLVDPVYSNNFRGGRVDGWAFAACLGACWLLALARNRKLASFTYQREVFLAGACLAISPFLWLNGPLLAPLVLLELTRLITCSAATTNGQARNPLRPTILAFAAGGLLVFALALLPMLLSPEKYWTSLMASIETQRFAAVVRKDYLALFLVHDPAIFIATIAALLIHRDWGLIVAAGVSLLMIDQTMVYLPRVMYLLPYMLAIIAAAATVAQKLDASAVTKQWLANRALALLLVWNVGVTFVTRPVITLQEGVVNDYSQVAVALERAIGPGEHRVLLEEWSGYAAGRHLGWKMYRYTTKYDVGSYLDLLKSMDYLVLRETPVYKNTLLLVDDAGFELQETLEFSGIPARRFGFGPVSIRIPGKSYVPINVYRKIPEALIQ